MRHAVLFALVCASLFGQSVRLPVKRVVLYKNGVGYFEHVGKVQGSQDVSVSFTSGQLNDVLKSLTVLDLGGGRIKGVTYSSAAPIERQLGELQLPAGEKTSLTDLLGALRGARMEVRSGTLVLAGRLLSIERKTRISGGTTLEVDYVSVLTDGGELRTTELSPAFSVRLLDKSVAGKMDRFVDLMASLREPETRRMVITADGTGERSVFVSYISETPVWKATYRLVLDAKNTRKPLLQGWAIVDNTIGQDWENVELSLVAGAPQSFIQRLSQPYFSRRPEVPLPEQFNPTPQTYQATLIVGGPRLAGTVTDPTGASIGGATVRAFDSSGARVGETQTDASGNYQFPTLPEGVLRIEVEAPGFRRARINGVAISNLRGARQDASLGVGAVTEAVEVTAQLPELQTQAAALARSGKVGTGGMLGRSDSRKMAAPPPPPEPRSEPAALLDAARESAESAAMAQGIGDLFEYKLKEPITIRKSQSAMAPIVQSAVGAEKVSIWNDQGHTVVPRRAIWLTNSSGLTLDGGSLTVLEGEAFAGEGIFEQIAPSERRLIAYASDLALKATSQQTRQPQAVTRVRIAKGVMTQESEMQERKTYTFRNSDTAPRTVVVEHPVRPGYDLRIQTKPEEISAGWMRFRVEVPPRQTVAFQVDEVRPLYSTYALTNLTSEQMAAFTSQRSIDKSIEDALRRVLAQKQVLADLHARKSARQEEAEKIFDDQQRVRENMKALKGSPEEKALLQRYTKQLTEQENRLETLGVEGKQLEAEEEKEQASLDRLLQEMIFDVKL